MKLTIRLPSVSKIFDDLESKKRKSVDVIFNNILELVDNPSLPRRRPKHPYSRSNPVFLSPLVHVHTGRLRKSVKKVDDGVVIDHGKAPHAKYVIEGTRYMIPRDFVKAALEKSIPELRKIWG